VLPLADAAKVAKQTQKLSAEDLYSEIFRIQKRHDEAFLGRVRVLEAQQNGLNDRLPPSTTP
jgi:hypothetical protein